MREPEPFEIEGLWEEIVARAAEFAGRRVRLTVLPAEPEASAAASAISLKARKMLEEFRELQRTPLTEEEKAILDEFEQFRREHPFRLRQIEE